MKLTGAAILVSRGTKVLQAAPAAYPYRSAARVHGARSMDWIMRKRFLLFFALLTSVLVIGFATHLLLMPRPRINLDAVQKIEPGMTRKQVEDLLGVAPGNYSQGGKAEYFGWGFERPPWGEEWIGDEVAIIVRFDDDDIVIGRGAGWVRRTEDWYFKVRVWLGLGK